MRVHGVQWNLVWENKEANFSKVRRLLAAQIIDPDDLLVFPEMFATGFTMNRNLTAEGLDSATMVFLSETARHHSAFLAAGMVRIGPDGNPRNETVVMNPEGRELFSQAKLQPFSPVGEENHHIPGDSVGTWDWNGIRVASMVCYDLRFPEAFRMAALAGAELFTVIANWPARRDSHWRLLLRARAVENQAWVLGVNRTGGDPNEDYAGGTLLADAMGTVLAEGGREDEVVSAAVDIDAIRAWRQAFPALKDARPDFLPPFSRAVHLEQ